MNTNEKLKKKEKKKIKKMAAPSTNRDLLLEEILTHNSIYVLE